jgi:hypothetical protein
VVTGVHLGHGVRVTGYAEVIPEDPIRAITSGLRTLPNGTSRRRLDRLSNRLTKILSEARKLGIP